MDFHCRLDLDKAERPIEFPDQVTSPAQQIPTPVHLLWGLPRTNLLCHLPWVSGGLIERRKNDPPPGAVSGLNKSATRLTRCNFLEQCNPLGPHGRLVRGKPGDVSAGSRHARYETGAGRISHLDEHDRYTASFLLQRPKRASALTDDYIRWQLNKFFRESLCAIGLAGTPDDWFARLSARRWRIGRPGAMACAAATMAFASMP